MQESFTAIEYAVLSFLRTARQSTVPAITSDLLLRLGETQEALESLVSKGFVEKVGEGYSPSALATNIPVAQIKKTPTGCVAMGRPLPAAAAAAAMPMPDVALVFKQARERAGRERAQGGI